jgi:hypothetical protein
MKEKERITYKFRKANLLEFWNGNDIVAELPVDPAPEQVGRFIAVAGLDVFAAAANEHEISLGEALVPVDFFDGGNPFVDRYGIEKYLCKVSDLAQGGLMAVPEIKAKSDELRKLNAEEEDRLAKQLAAKAKIKNEEVELSEDIHNDLSDLIFDFQKKLMRFPANQLDSSVAAEIKKLDRMLDTIRTGKLHSVRKGR